MLVHTPSHLHQLLKGGKGEQWFTQGHTVTRPHCLWTYDSRATRNLQSVDLRCSNFTPCFSTKPGPFLRYVPVNPFGTLPWTKIGQTPSFKTSFIIWEMNKSLHELVIMYAGYLDLCLIYPAALLTAHRLPYFVCTLCEGWEGRQAPYHILRDFIPDYWMTYIHGIHRYLVGLAVINIKLGGGKPVPFNN